MFFKQYNYKPRSGSQSSQAGSGSAIEGTDNAARADSPPAKADTAIQGNTSPVSAAIAGRRRVRNTPLFLLFSPPGTGFRTGNFSLHTC
jgi:hypothetical protein